MRILIVGSGLVGVSTAYFLAKEGHQVRVIEGLPGVAQGASFANASLLTPSLSAPWISFSRGVELFKSMFSAHPAVRLKPRSLWGLVSWGCQALKYMGPRQYGSGLSANYKLSEYNWTVLDELQLALPDLRYDQRRTGSLVIFRNRNALNAAVLSCRLLEELGIDCEPLEVEGVLEKESCLRPIGNELAGGIYQSLDGSGDSYKFCLDIERECRALGVEFMYNTLVSSMLLDDGKLLGMSTSAGALEADRYIIAAGSNSSTLVASTGVKAPIYPVKGYSITLDMPKGVHHPVMPIVDAESHAALTPLGKQLRVTGFAELAGKDSAVYSDRIEFLKALVGRTYPANSEGYLTGKINAWSGFRPLSCDGVPLIGSTCINNLYMNTGHGTLGWTMAAASGKLLAELIEHKESSIDISPYSPMRFS